MKSYLPILLVVVCVGSTRMLSAQETKKAQTAKKVVLLRNGNVMEGEIRHTSTQIFIRNGTAEIGLSVQLVMRICADWDDTYAFVQTLVKADDPNDHVDLARWCHRHGLKDKALEQARKALALKPTHEAAKQLVTALERAALETATPSIAQPMPKQANALPIAEPATSVDLTAETQIAFATRVQPILMNTCANCHCTGRGGNFHLERVTAASQKIATQKNLARLFTYIDFERPAISPLLVKAVMPHGKAQQSPIKDRNAAAFLSIQYWIMQTIECNPHLKDYRAAKKSPVASQPPTVRETPFASAAKPAPASATVSQTSQQPRFESKLSTQPEVQGQTKENSPPRLLPMNVTQTPVTALPPDDPFNPDIFNKVYHPQR